ncbi:MAG: CRISPR-associated endonuclease Cas2 [Polyangiaceae bacterium]|nr:CRISPR-associated endonuclease Cas2 [Polyangiaceae bacterium]
MMVLITYDINTATPAGQKRLRKVAKECQNLGQRVQNSVFECLIDAAQFTMLKRRLTEIIDGERDSLRFYQLGEKWAGRVEHVGAKPSVDLTGPLFA